jgi:type II secretory pathway component PulJ
VYTPGPPAHRPRHPPPSPRAQAALLDSLYGTERGLAASSELRAEINELISQLEAHNPTPSPTEVRATRSSSNPSWAEGRGEGAGTGPLLAPAALGSLQLLRLPACPTASGC